MNYMLSILLVINCFTTNIEQFRAEETVDCESLLIKTLDINGTYPGDITVTITYNFNLAANGRLQIANTPAAMEAYRGAVKANEAFRHKYPKVALYTIIMRDTVNELCRFSFNGKHSLPTSAKCAAWVENTISND